MRYSPAEVQTLLNIPESTLRRLARDFLPPKQTKKRTYSERDISTLRLAREKLIQGLTTKQIRLELEKVVDLSPEEPAEETALAPIDRRLSQLNSELEQLRQAAAADRQRIEALERQIEALNRPFWKRLLKRP